MIYFRDKLEKEKAILDKMIEISTGELTNDFILRQSRKVDKLVAIYQKSKRYSIQVHADKNMENKSVNVG